MKIKFCIVLEKQYIANYLVVSIVGVYVLKEVVALIKFVLKNSFWKKKERKKKTFRFIVMELDIHAVKQLNDVLVI